MKLNATPVNRLTHQDLQDDKKVLLKLPPNFFKSKKYEGVSLRDFLSMDDHAGSLSVSAINRYLMNAKAVLGYGVRNGHLETNYADGLQLPKSKRPQEEREAFDTKDLKRIFSSKHYKKDSFKQPFMFWLPVLGAYTGCRIEELCQLHCDDVKKVDGLTASLRLIRRVSDDICSFGKVVIMAR